MILYLDHKIFGNGYGLSSPNCNNIFYWLVNSQTNKGELYTFSPGFGSQLHSIQWRHPKSGEVRTFGHLKFKPFHSQRKWFRVEVAWAVCEFLKDAEDLRTLKKNIQNIC